MLPSTNLDAVTVQRQAATSDAEGNPTGTLAAQWSGQATYGSASASDRQIAAQRGEQVDGFLTGIPLGTDIAPGDVVTCRGKSWLVTDVNDVRLWLRVAMRRTAE